MRLMRLAKPQAACGGGVPRMLWRAFWSAVAVCVFLPGVARAQPDVGGFGTHGYPYGPRVAPPWSYPGVYGGPFVGYAEPLTPRLSVGAGYGYPGFGYGGFGYPGYWRYSGRAGSYWSNGLSLYG